MFGLWSGVALAQAAPDSLAVIDGPAQSVQVQVRGHVGPQCGFAPGGAPSHLPQLRAEGGGVAPQTLQFKLACNGAFAVQVRSASGGLRTEHEAESTDAINAGFRAAVPYNLRLSVARNSGGELSETCSAEALRAGGAACAMSSETGLLSEHPSMGLASSLTLEFPEAVLPREYLAGLHTDALTITVSSQL